MKLEIRTPQTPKEFERYYHLRWQLLRAPWNQPQGSEKDELENESTHRIAVEGSEIIGVGRLHFVEQTTAQVRYMAVDKNFEKHGIGKAILEELEKEAFINNAKIIVLHARELAVGFYENQGYKVIKNSHLLFNEIQHYEMHKILE